MIMRRQQTAAVIGMLGSLAFAGSLAAGVPLVDHGRPVAVVAIPAQADEHERRAAQELIDHVEQMSGARLEVSEIDAADATPFVQRTQRNRQTPVLIGRLAQPRLDRVLRAKSQVGGTFALQAAGGTVWIAGLAEGPASSFPSRWFQMPNKEWQVRVRCGGPVFPGAHGLKGPNFKTQPELFALINGERSPRQHCLSNPKLLDAVVDEIKKQRAQGRGPVIGMGPNDGSGFCECDECRKLDGGDFDSFSFEPSVTDRYIWFFNQVLDRLAGDDPDTRIAFYIYHAYMRPPVRWKPNPKIMGAMAPISLDRVHGFSNPVAPEKSYVRWLYQEWGQLLPELYDRGYWSNLACPGFPFINVDRLRDEIPACHGFGVKGWRVETFPNYASALPANYVAARLMWDHTADVDAILADFSEKFFGSAAKPMLAYVRLLDAALRDSPNCTGSSWDMPYFYPAAVRREARQLLDEAARLAASADASSGLGDAGPRGLDEAARLVPSAGPYRERVAVVTETFDLLEAFIAMLERRTAGDFAAAQAELDKLDAAANRLMSYEPVPMLSAGRFSTYVNYMKRFFRPCTEQGYARVTGGNRLAALANDEWQFLIDPPRVGESIGLWRPEVSGGQWQTIKTSSSSWSNQGLRYYKGLAWYRQTLDVPAEFQGRRLFVWCGGVDEKANVWLNGRELGISPGAAFYPFELDATEAARPGEPNVLVMAVINDVVNELGTGGLVAPVMLYAPAKGRDAQLENLRPLGETFP